MISTHEANECIWGQKERSVSFETGLVEIRGMIIFHVTDQHPALKYQSGATHPFVNIWFGRFFNPEAQLMPVIYCIFVIYE